MNGKQLKNSILQWAIQGKLVPQDPNDEPASVLLDKIRQEKERLIKEKKIKRDKNASIIYRGEDNSYYEKMLVTGEVKCIDEEIPFDVPNGWEWCRIASLADVVRGGSPRPAGSPIFYDGSIPFLKVADLTRESSIYVKSFSSTIKEAGLSKTRLVKAGTLLLTNSGATLGVPKICTFDTTFNDGVAAFLSLDERLKLYVYWFFCYMTDLYRNINQGTAQPNLNTDIIKMTLVPIPPYKEQIRIIEQLGNISPIIAYYEKVQDELDELNESIPKLIKQSILQEAIRGKLVPQIAEEGTAQELLEQIKTEKQKLVKEGKLKKSALNDSVIFRDDDNKYYEQIGKKCLDITDEIPFPIPNNWAWSRLSSMCSIVNGFTPLRSESKFWDCGTINWFTVEDIKNQGEMIYSTKQKITDEATSKERIVRAGSVLLCCTASVGQCALAKIDLTTNQQFNALTVKDVNRFILTDNYLFWFAKTLKATLQRLSGKTTFEFVSVKKVGNILIPIPPFQEQQRIVAQIEKLFEQLR
ncbi:restriction endonuclease subunit S [Prevotella copri]|uniref:restriction endonuclease subunit S n=1 Tax=Segatella copri TaxID=165179 RepID=UPI001C2B8006|nr:restriction endonuclease subunit S [Segatella copri]MBU9906585.1 restriction endonuclease subunit S [Segatella copri]MBV3395184.1 restriction endonuclease subunit S [Segatella copri]MBV3404755.1 restriction endonuclease subunit S [Segatella copri]